MDEKQDTNEASENKQETLQKIEASGKSSIQNVTQVAGKATPEK